MSTSNENMSEQKPGEQTLFDQDPGEGPKEESRWSSQDRFPLNEKVRGIGGAVAESYEASSSFSIVTAYTLLEHLLAFFGQHDFDGSEPTTAEADLYAGTRPTYC